MKKTLFAVVFVAVIVLAAIAVPTDETTVGSSAIGIYDYCLSNAEYAALYQDEISTGLMPEYAKFVILYQDERTSECDSTAALNAQYTNYAADYAEYMAVRPTIEEEKLYNPGNFDKQMAIFAADEQNATRATLAEERNYNPGNIEIQMAMFYQENAPAITTTLPARGGMAKATVTPFTTRTGAVCNDATVSKATGTGACSTHGGVANWIVK